MSLDFINDLNIGKYKPEAVKTDHNILKKMVIRIGKAYDSDFEIKKETFESKLYTNLIYYFTDDQRCEWNLSKGLMFTGKKGLGKSMSLKIMHKLFHCGYNIPPIQRQKYFKMIGMESLAVKKGKSMPNLEDFYVKIENNLFCDEVMRESDNETKQINNFGTLEQPFSIGIHQMYRNFTDNGKLYHFSTNYWSLEDWPNGSYFAEIYGNEIHDRIVEMCNIIEFTGKSKRK